MEFEIDVFTGGMAMTNGYLMFPGGEKPCVVVDAPEGITEWLVGQRVKVGALILTHLHYDHVIDVAKIQKEFGCPVYSYAQPDDELTLKSLMARAFGMEWMVEDFEVDHLLEGESSVSPTDDFTFDILHVPGHSPDSICFLPQGTELMFGGDVLFQDGIGRSDFPNGDGELLVKGIREKVLTLPPETVVLPGHGPTTTVGSEKATNPFLR